MKVKVQEDRKVYIIKGTDTNALGTQNENNVTELEIVVPEQYQDFNKKIVFINDDEVIWDIIENNTYKITNAITKYKSVEFYIWLTKGTEDFRSETKTLRLNKNLDPNGEITEEEIGGVNKVINLLESEIIKVTDLENKLTQLVTDIQNKLENGEFNGKDGANGKDGEDDSIITNIYLDKPLGKTDDYVDYIDFKNQKIVRYEDSVAIEENIELPKIPTLEDTTVLQVNTKIQPSNMEVKYYRKGA